MEKLAKERQTLFEKLSYSDKHLLWDEVKGKEKKMKRVKF
jgi:hypothetical protein